MTTPVSGVLVPVNSRCVLSALVLTIGVLLGGCAPKGEALYQRAAASLAKGEVGGAVIDLKNLVEAEPQNAKARALLAEASLQSGDLKAAEIEIRKAIDLGAPAELTLGTDCRVLAASGESDKVLARCVADKVPGEAKANVHVARGEALLAAGRSDDAKAEFSAAVAAKPDSLDALLGLVTVAAQANDFAAARVALDGANGKVKERARYWFAVGQLNAATGDFAAAEKAYAMAVAKAEAAGAVGDKIQALVGLADAQLRQARTSEAKATGGRLAEAAPDIIQVKIVRAQIASAAGDYEEARTLLEGVLAKQPGNQQARTLLGVVNLRQGNLGQAEMNLASVVANDPNNVQAQRLLVETRSRLQKPQQTLEALKTVIEQNPDPSLLAMAARLSMASGDRQQAVAYLSQAVARQDQRVPADVQLEIASGFASAGEYDRAIELLRAMPRSGAGGGYQREYLLIGALLRKGDKEAAVAEAKALLESSGDSPVVRNLVAAAYMAAGQPDAGREQLMQVLKSKPDDVDALLNLARLDLAEGKTADAENGFRKVLAIDPKSLAAATGAALAAGAGGDKAGAERWLLKAANDHPDSLDAKLALVRFYLANGEFVKAKALVNEAAKKSPDNAAVANLRGLVLLGSKDGPGAIQSFADAARLAPKEPEFTLNLARAKLVTGDAKGALSVMDGFLADNPKNVVGLQLASAMALQGREVEKAAGYIERLRQASPDQPATDRFEGDLAMAQKRYKDALTSYRKAGAKGKDSALVLAEYSAGKLSGVADPLKSVEEWVDLHPEDSRAVTIVAESKRAAGNRDAAIALYERGVAKAPRDVGMLNNLAILYQEKGDPRAVEMGQRAYDQLPNSPPIMDTYGWILADAGRLDEALKLLDAAFKAAPNVGEIGYHYAAALVKAGKPDAALPVLRKALAGELPPAVRTDAQKLLKQLSR